MDWESAKISRHTPLRLEAAVKLAFPAGGMTVAGLRKEIKKGRLEVELIAGKHFTTLAAIERMRELCRVGRKEALRNEGRPRRDDVSVVSNDEPKSELELLVETTRKNLFGSKQPRRRTKQHE